MANGITSPTVDAYIPTAPSSGNGRSNSQSMLCYVFPSTSGKTGDANGDGFVTMADANLVVNYFLAAEKSAIDINIDAANVNGDDDITMADANQIVNMFLSGNSEQ